MNINEILELTRAGWTKAEILQIQTSTPAVEPAPVQTEVREEHTEVREEQTKEPNTQQPDFAAILTELGAIKASIHSSNVTQLQQPNQAAPETSEQILARLLVPDHK